MENKRNEIPEYVVLPHDMESFKSHFNPDVVTNAYRQLKSIKDLSDVIPDDVKDINGKAVKSYIDGIL